MNEDTEAKVDVDVDPSVAQLRLCSAQARASVSGLRDGGWLLFVRNDGRWYWLGWQMTLFGWAVVRIHGGKGAKSERTLFPMVFESFDVAEPELVRQVHRRLSRGYVVQKM